MPRKSMTGDTHSPVVRFRVDKEVQTILDEEKDREGNISKFIREKIKSPKTESPSSNCLQEGEIINKLFRFFSNPAVKGNLPDNVKETFLSSLTVEEKNKIQEILKGDLNE